MFLMLFINLFSVFTGDHIIEHFNFHLSKTVSCSNKSKTELGKIQGDSSFFKNLLRLSF